ncbi:MAG: zinc ribbon domain-containing protein [Methanobacteriaceae archaeon]|nr:zinc ribbon domain-containing protein [Methanobacteriaceae archaeon]
MVYCSNCGEKNKKGNKFCSNCGKILNKSFNGFENSKPIKSRLKSKEETYHKSDYPEKSSKMQNYENTPEVTFEWNIVIVGGLITVIISGVLGWALQGLSVIIGASTAIIYALLSTRRKSTIILIIPLILIMAASIFALFSL